MPGDSIKYLSANSIAREDDFENCLKEVYTVKFLNDINCSKLPHYMFLRGEFRRVLMGFNEKLNPTQLWRVIINLNQGG